MKNIPALLLATAAALLTWAPALQAQEPVTTGTVQKIDMESGKVTVLSDQTHRPVEFTGLQTAQMVSTKGGAPQMSDLREGMPITLQYAVRGRLWVVEKVIFGDEAPAGTPNASGTTSSVAPMPMTPGQAEPTAGIGRTPRLPTSTALPSSTFPSSMPNPNSTALPNNELPTAAPLPTSTAPGAPAPASQTGASVARLMVPGEIPMPAPSNQAGGGSVVRSRSGGNAP